MRIKIFRNVSWINHSDLTKDFLDEVKKASPPKIHRKFVEALSENKKNPVFAFKKLIPVGFLRDI